MKKIELHIECCFECPYLRSPDGCRIDHPGIYYYHCCHPQSDILHIHKTIVKDMHPSCPLQDIPLCPSCGSMHIAYILGSRRKIHCRSCNIVSDLS